MSDDYAFSGKRTNKKDLKRKRKFRAYKKGGQHRTEGGK